MALKSNRYGVRNDQVDVYGRPIASAFYNSLTQDLPEWTDLPSWKNGTEHVLPDNDDEPESTCFVGDIQYPSGLEEDARFFYRKSPTEKDGLAKIRDIRGWTVVWNQLCYNGNFATATNWSLVTADSLTFTVSDNVGILTMDLTGVGQGIMKSSLPLQKGHKYLFQMDAKVSVDTPNLRIGASMNNTTLTTDNLIDVYSPLSNTWRRYSTIKPLTGDNVYQYGLRIAIPTATALPVGESLYLRNITLFDLTKKLGSTLADQIYAMEQAHAGDGVTFWRQYWWLAYYKHDTGRLLSFTADKIKTVGKNLVDNDAEISQVTYYASDGIARERYGYKILLPAGTYRGSVRPKTPPLDPSDNIYLYGSANTMDGKVIQSTPFIAINSVIDYTITSTEPFYWAIYDGANLGLSNAQRVFGLVNIQIEIGSTTTPYEPYVSHETSLPINTFFPTGMKSAGSVYDELTPTRAITRIGAVDMGTLNWTYSSTTGRFAVVLADGKPTGINRGSANALCVPYVIDSTNTYQTLPNGSIMVGSNYSSNTSCAIVVHDETYDDADDFKTAMDGVYLFYELAEEVVQATMSFE